MQECIKWKEALWCYQVACERFGKCARMLHEDLLISVLMYKSEEMQGKRKKDLGLDRWVILEVCWL